MGRPQSQAERFEKTHLLTTATAIWFPWHAKTPTCDFTLKPTSVVTMAYGVWRPVCMATKDVTISETQTNKRRHIQHNTDLKTNKI